MQLQRLVYRSRAAERVQVAMLADIVRTATRRNARLNVTGLLLLTDDRFLQVLEGPAASIALLVGRIFRDRRHEELRILLVEDTEKRLFPQWGMEGVFLDEWSAPERDALTERYGRSGRGVVCPDDPHEAMGLLLDVERYFHDRVPAHG